MFADAWAERPECPSCEKGTACNILFSYAKVYSVTYDSGSVPRRAIFCPRGASPLGTVVRPSCQIAASIYDEYSVGLSICPTFTRLCLTMTSMIQVCSNLNRARVFITNTRPDEIRSRRRSPASKRKGAEWPERLSLLQKGHTSKHFDDFYLEAKARIWP